MSAVKVGCSGSGGGLPAIPANARKVVQNVKEIVNNSDEEIYAVLKECGMDPNEAVQRLIYQDTFREVKRKRDRKKENLNNKELGDTRPRPAGVGLSIRGGRVPDRSAGRGYFAPRYNSGGFSSGQSYSHSVSENGVYQIVKTPSMDSTIGLSSSLSPAQVKPVPTGISAAVSNGLSSTPSQRVHPTWNSVSGHAILAEVVKSTGAPQSVTSVSSTVMPILSVSPSSCNVSAEMQLPSSVTVNSFSESCASGSVSACKKDTCMPVNHMPFGDQDIPSVTVGMGVTPSSSLLPCQMPDRCITDSNALASDAEAKVTGTHNCCVSVLDSPPEKQFVNRSLGADAGSLMAAHSTLGPTGSAGARSAVISNQHQQQPVGTQKASRSVLEWKPKLPAQIATSTEVVDARALVCDDARSSVHASSSEDTGMLTLATSKLRGLSVQDEQVVIIPDHLQVPESGRMQLSFGSFEASISSSFVSEDDTRRLLTSVEETGYVNDALEEEPVSSSLRNPTTVTLDQDYTHQPISSPVESIVSSNVALSIPVPAISHQAILKPEAVQQIPQYSYLQTTPRYLNLGLVPQVIGSQYTFEPTESQPQEHSRPPNFMQAYSDPSNIYNSVLRANSDGDVRYPQIVLTNPSSKYSGNTTLMTGQSLSSSLEGVSSVVSAAAGPAGQTSQTTGIARTLFTVPQQPLSAHAYPGQPAGVPISPFGYQYVPPGCTYMPPYQNYTGNAGYHQLPAGNSYAPATGSGFPTAAPSGKYPLPQYKPVTGAGSSHSAVAVGYGNYTTAPLGFSVNPAATSGSASGYDDVGGGQYKQSHLYIPNQQQRVEGPAVWVQAQLSRDMAGLQTNSYYNVPAQGHHTGYIHTQPIHAHPVAAYASLYHSSQSGAAPTVQLLQQPQALGSLGVGSIQATAYQQPQRSHFNWTNGY